MKYILILISFLLGMSTVQSQSSVIKQLKEEEKVLTEYYLYPSTLRMINIQRDPALDKLVKPIRRLSLLSMDDQKFDLQDLQSAARQMQEEEAYENYMEMSGPDNNLFVLGKEKQEYTCVIAQMDSSYYIVEIQGKIDLMELSNLYTAISDQDSTADASFIDVFDLMQDDNRRKRERKDWERRTEEKRKKHAKEEQMKKDSLEAIRREQEIEQ